MGLFKFFHSTSFYHNVQKSFLGELRKKTGYSLSNCRKALELHDNDLIKAEEWLKEQAKALGWSALTKVQNRKAVQGLIGVAINNKKVTMVEVNCETDFVSKNDKFTSLVKTITNACFDLPVITNQQETNEITLTKDELTKLEYNGKLISDEIAILIGSIGENIFLKRAVCFETRREDINLVAAVHPPVINSPVLLGKYGVFLSFQKSPETCSDESENIEYDICRHIIGLNPTRIGNYNENEEPNCETDLIHQNFLIDDSITVGELLKEHGINVLNFKRFECGEPETQKEVNVELQNNLKEPNAVESKI